MAELPGIEVSPVGGAADRRAFLAFPWTVHAGDPLWVPPLLPERRATLDPRRGEFFTRGEAESFLARRGGRVVGTLVAAVDRAANAREKRRRCLFGFLDYLDDPEIPRALLARAEAWGRARGLDELYGPINLDYENAYGVLVEGRDRPPVLLCGHSPAYYLPTMESLGFTAARADNIAFELRLDRPLPGRDRLARLARAARERKGISVRVANFRDYQGEVDRVHGLLNRSLAHLDDFTPYERSSVEALFAPFKRFADPELILFAEKADGETVGFFPAMPDLNEALATLDGLRRPRDWLRLPFAFRRRYACVTVKSVLVPPAYWGAGVAAVLFDAMVERLEGRGFSWMDLSLTAVDNPNTPVLAERFGARVYKRYRLFRRAIGD